MKAFSLISILWLALSASACSDDDHNHDQHDGHVHQHDGGHNLDEEGCEHLEQGPFVDVNAGNDPPGAAEVKADHQAYRVTLVSGAPGFVKLAVAAGGHRVLFFDTDVALEVQDDQGNALTIEKTEKSIPECTVVKAKHTVDLPAAGTYFFKLGPDSAATTVTLVIEEA
jgi:hypothetical protein